MRNIIDKSTDRMLEDDKVLWGKRCWSTPGLHLGPCSNPGGSLPPACSTGWEEGTGATQRPVDPNRWLTIIFIFTNNGNNNISLCLRGSLYSLQRVSKGITMLTLSSSPEDWSDTPSHMWGPHWDETRTPCQASWTQLKAHYSHHLRALLELSIFIILIMLAPRWQFQVTLGR